MVAICWNMVPGRGANPLAGRVEKGEISGAADLAQTLINRVIRESEHQDLEGPVRIQIGLPHGKLRLEGKLRDAWLRGLPHPVLNETEASPASSHLFLTFEVDGLVCPSFVADFLENSHPAIGMCWTGSGAQDGETQGLLEGRAWTQNAEDPENSSSWSVAHLGLRRGPDDTRPEGSDPVSATPVIQAFRKTFRLRRSPTTPGTSLVLLEPLTGNRKGNPLRDWASAILSAYYFSLLSGSLEIQLTHGRDTVQCNRDSAQRLLDSP